MDVETSAYNNVFAIKAFKYINKYENGNKLMKKGVFIAADLEKPTCCCIDKDADGNIVHEDTCRIAEVIRGMEIYRMFEEE